MRPPPSRNIFSMLIFNPTSSRSTPRYASTHSNVSFSAQVSSPKANFFFCLKTLRCISTSPWAPSKKSLSLFTKLFYGSFSVMLHPDAVSISQRYQVTKLERLYRAVSGSFSSSPIPLFLLEASLPPLRVTPTHFALSWYERALRLPISFPISCSARPRVKPRLSRYSWRVFASTHPLMLSPT